MSYIRLLLQFIPRCCFNIGKKVIVKCSAVQLSMIVVHQFLRPAFGPRKSNTYECILFVHYTGRGIYANHTSSQHERHIYLIDFRIPSECQHRHQEILQVFVVLSLRSNNNHTHNLSSDTFSTTPRSSVSAERNITHFAPDQALQQRTF